MDELKLQNAILTIKNDFLNRENNLNKEKVLAFDAKF